MVDKTRRATSPDAENRDRKREPVFDEYREVGPALHMVRIMYRFFDEIVDLPPYRSVHASLLTAYEKILNEELAPYALSLALAIAELEDAYPEITGERI